MAAMFHQKRQIIKQQQQLILAALFLILTSKDNQANSQQLGANGGHQTSSNILATNWSPNEDSWNYWWSYSGISGPSYWGLLNLDWHMCDKGRRQSPINIETNRLVYDPHLSNIQLDNNLISGILYNDGHAIVFNASAKLRHRQQHATIVTAAATTNSIDDTNANSLGMSKTDNIHESQTTTTAAAAAATATKMTYNRSRRNLQDVSIDSDNVFIKAESKTEDLSQKIDLSISQSKVLDANNHQYLDQIPMLDQKEQQPFSSLISDRIDRISGSVAAAYDDDDVGSNSNNNNDDDNDDDISNKAQISGAGLSYNYRFEAIYFRFGLDNQQSGSEHLINSRWHAAELQIFAYNSILYKSFFEASNKPHGLLAISILVDILEQSNNHSDIKKQQTKHLNGQLEKLLLPLSEIKYRNQMVEVREFNLSALLPERSEFVTYEGSLNIPGCHESVDWLILNRPLYITQSNLDLLRSISADEQKSDTASGTLIAGNLRPIQLINNRPIRTNIKPPSKVNNENPAACQRLWTRYDYKLGSGNK